MKDVQLKREPLPSPKLIINPKIKSLKDLETWVTMDDFKLIIIIIKTSMIRQIYLTQLNIEFK